MAERRMFAKTIIDSDAFLDMPLSAQALYFHLSMRADDEGFVNNPKKVQRMVGCNDDDTRLLLAKSFIIGFESGVVVIKHWRIHNYIQSDRFKPTAYQDERNRLEVKENKAYTIKTPDQTQVDTQCIQDASRMDTQVRLGKVRLGKEREEETPLPKLDEDDEAPTQFVVDAIAVLNEITGKSFAVPTGAAYLSLRRLFDQGRTIDDVRHVVTVKQNEWRDNPKMTGLVRPSTLFGDKFDEYLNQEVPEDEIDPEFIGRF